MENSQLDCWKESLCAALTHSDGTRLNRTLSHLCKSLGERLAEANDPSAILCYICAGGIEEIIETWPEGENQEIQELQDLVEIVVVMQKALQSHNVQGKHADLLAQYASLLAAQGALGTALEYLKVAGSPNSIELRDRLCHALGQVAQVKQMQQPAARRQSDYSTWGQPQMGGVKTHLPQMTQMPDARPPSVGNASKSKYLLDPSVSSGGNYNFQPQATPFQHPTYQQPQTMPFQPQPTLYQPQATPASNFPQMFNPAPAGNYGQRNSFSHGNEGPPMSAPPMASQMPAQYKNPTPPPGWNDPPEPRAGRPQVNLFCLLSFIILNSILCLYSSL